MKNKKISNAANILLNMSSGLLPQDLTLTEIKILKKTYGPNWFEKLGYDDVGYKRPHK